MNIIFLDSQLGDYIIINTLWNIYWYDRIPKLCANFQGHNIMFTNVNPIQQYNGR